MYLCASVWISCVSVTHTHTRPLTLQPAGRLSGRDVIAKPGLLRVRNGRLHGRAYTNTRDADAPNDSHDSECSGDVQRQVERRHHQQHVAGGAAHG